jgi:hypothetical protein
VPKPEGSYAHGNSINKLKEETEPLGCKSIKTKMDKQYPATKE